MKNGFLRLFGCVLFYLAVGANFALAQSSPGFVTGQILTAQQLNNAFSNVLSLNGGTLTGPLTVPSLTAAIASIGGGTVSGATITGGAVSGSAITGATINGTPIGSTTPSTGAFTNSSVSGTFTVTNGTDAITATNNANNVLVFSGSGGGTAKSLAVTSFGSFIASSDSSVGDGVAFKSDYYNTAVFQGLNSSGTAGYDTNVTLYRPSSANNAYMGVTMSASPTAEQHLWMGTDYTNNRYVFTQTVTGTGAYLPTAFRNGQADAFVIGSGATPPTTFYGGGVVLAGTEGNQVTWALGGQTWSWNMASGGNIYLHEGTHNKFPLTIVPNSTAALNINASSSTFTGGLDSTAIGPNTPSTGAFTTLSASSTVSGAGFTSYLASPPAIGSTAANSGAFTNLSSSGTVSGTGFSNYLASPPAIGSTTANTGRFSTLSSTGTGAMPLYSTTGAGVNAPHMVQGAVALSSGSATVTLSGSAVFSSSSSYTCTANDTTTANAVKVSQSSGTSITFTGTGTDSVQFLCAGS
ncbi:hypothetical protein [Burkholderia cenocepacia]|uniref:hypothetical protein n=1 Tax=Burkholderia cenocepacia TaxID=95486 RepID=UPI001F5C0AA9|nr:hypothetical protein [Burkholderia cenocepacia]